MDIIKEIRSNLKIEDYLLRLKNLNDELKISYETGTLIKGEFETIQKQQLELICIIEYLKIIKGSENK